MPSRQARNQEGGRSPSAVEASRRWGQRPTSVIHPRHSGYYSANEKLAQQIQLTKLNKSFAARYTRRDVNTAQRGIIATECVWVLSKLLYAIIEHIKGCANKAGMVKVVSQEVVAL